MVKPQARSIANCNAKLVSCERERRLRVSCALLQQIKCAATDAVAAVDFAAIIEAKVINVEFPHVHFRPSHRPGDTPDAWV